MSEIFGTGVFEDVTRNQGTIEFGEFNDKSTNAGVVLDTATFAHSSVNIGALSGHGIFLDNSACSSSLIKGPVIFTGQSINTATLREAVFMDSSVNNGTITVSAVFINSSSNTGTVQGSAVFLNTSSNSGTVQNAKMAISATNTGTIVRSVAVVPDSFSADGYYVNGQKIAPNGWPIVVHEINGYWFKYNSLGTSSLATGIFSDGTNVYNFKNGVKISSIITTTHPYIRLDYAANDQVLVNGSSVLWTGQHAAASLASNLSGTADVDTDGDIDLWTTANNGLVSWAPVVYHPYLQLGYYTDNEPLIQGVSKLWSSFYSGATTINNISGYAEFNEDTNNEIFQTDGTGTVTWFTVSAHPYYHFGYYANAETLINGGFVILWNGTGTGALRVRNSSGTADADSDGNLDQWSTSLGGFVTWYMLTAHSYANLGYFTDSPTLTSGISVLYDGKGTGASLVTNASGTSIDLDSNGNTDTWYTNASGVINWGDTVFHPYPVSSYFADSLILVNNSSKLYVTQYSGAATANLVSGTDDLNGDGNNDSWSTNGQGTVTYAMVTAHPFEHFGYYADVATLVDSETILWNGKGTGATIVALSSGSADIDDDGEVDNWVTNANGVISWSGSIIYPYAHLGYFAADETLQSGTTVLYDGQTILASTAVNLSGIADINEDEDDEQWTTNGSGAISWYTISAHPFENLGYYTSEETLVNGTTIIFQNFGTSSSTVANVSGTADADGDQNDDSWSTNQNGIVTWYMITAHPYDNTFGGYYDEYPPTSGSTFVWNGPGTGAEVLINLSGSDLDIDGDGNLDDWSISSIGKLTWSTFIAYTNSITLGSNTYYYNGGLTSGTTTLYNSQGSGATLAASTSGTEDFDPAAGLEKWNINSNGVLSWEAAFNHQSSITLGSVVYYYDSPLINGSTILYANSYSDVFASSASGQNIINGLLSDWSIVTGGVLSWAAASIYPNELDVYHYTGTLTSGTTVLYNTEYADATIAASVSGTFDVDQDGNLDEWQTANNGVVSWVMQIAYTNSITLGSNTYYYNGGLTSGTTTLYNSQGSGATTVTAATGTAELNSALYNIEDWTISQNGIISWENNYSSSAPIENNGYWYTYVDGVSSAANGAYVNGYYDNGTKSTTYDNATPQYTVDEGWYTYVDGVPTAANGAYTNGYYDVGVKSTVHSNETPADTIDGGWYTYNEGVASAANGAYSNGYYIDGTVGTGYSNETPQYAIDEDWYTYLSGVASAANGAYSNGYYSNGTKSTTYDNATPTDTIDGGWYTYVDGVASLADGAYSNGYYSNGTKSSTYDNATPTDAIDGGWYTIDGGWYTYVDGVASLADGAYSNGYYGNGTKSSTYNNATPTDTIDAGWYTYVDGVPTAANGAYSNGYYESGTASTSYDNATPTDTIDGGWYTYVDGVASAANGAYTNGYYGNGTKSDTYDNPTPTDTIDAGWYTYVDGVPTAANGVYSNGYYESGTASTSYNNETAAPDQAQDNSLWYQYVFGVPTLKQSAGPIETPSGSNLWYTYTNGVQTAANGAYMSGYYESGAKSTVFDNTTPLQSQDEPTKWIIYLDGVSSVAVGAYSNGYYSLGIIHPYYSNATPQQPQDDVLWYVYAAGVASLAEFAAPIENSGLWYTYASGIQTAANGAYSTGYYENGIPSTTYDNPIPTDTIDGEWYTYVDGVPSLATQSYSNYYFTSLGEIDGSYNNIIPQQPQDDVLWYVYASGVASLAESGSPIETPLGSGLYYLYSMGVQTLVLHFHSFLIGGTTYYANNYPVTSGATLYVTMTTNDLAAAASGVQDLDGDGADDDWTIDAGVVSWSQTVAYANSVTLGSNTYYYNGTFEIGTILHLGTASNAATAGEDDGVQDLDGDGADDDWTIDADGVVSWSQTVAYANSVTLGGNTYYYNGTLETGTILHTGSASNAATAGEDDGVQDLDGDENPDTWSIDSSGVLTITIASRNSINLQNTSGGTAGDYYYDGTLTSNSTILYQGGLPTAPEALYMNSQDPDVDGAGPIDIDGDGRLEHYQVGGEGETPGLFLFFDAIVHPYIVNFGFAQDTTTSTSGSTILYTSEYSDATTAAADTGLGYIGGESGLQDWTINANGVLSWSQHDLANYFTIGSTTYHYDGTLTNGSTQVYVDANGTAYGTGSGEHDFGDGNAAWSINGNGVISWNVIDHTGTIVIDLVTYYYDVPFANGTILYTSATSNIGRAPEVTTPISYGADLNGDSIADSFTIGNDGIVAVVPGS